METLIEYNWRPAKKTSTSLIKLGYSQKQLDTIGKMFLQRYGGQTLENASTIFFNMVRSSGAAHNTPKPDMNVSRKIDKDRAKAIANRSEDSHNKAVESHNVDSAKLSDEDALAFYMRHRF